MSNQRYPEEFKIEAVKQVTERGLPVAEVAARLTAGGNSTVVMDEKSILLQVGKSKIVLEDNGTITIEGLNIAVNGTELVDVDAKKIDLN